jgi:hypothetical protein
VAGFGAVAAQVVSDLLDTHGQPDASTAAVSPAATFFLRP